MEAEISGGAARGLLRIIEVKGKETNSHKELLAQLSSKVSLFLNGAFMK